MDIEKVLDVARSEVMSPTWLITKQLLFENEVVYKDGLPVVEDITFPEEDVAVVWFPIVNQSYYFIAYVDCIPTPELRTVCMSAGNTVSLVVVSERHSLEQLTINLSGVQFSDTWQKGEVKRKTIRGDILWEHSGFEINPYPKNTGEVEDKVKAIIELLKGQKQQIRELSEAADAVEVSIGYFGYQGQMWGIHLEPSVIRELAELGVSVDIDLYASGPDLVEVPD